MSETAPASTRAVRVVAAWSDVEGSCNGCSEHRGRHRVYLVDLRGISVRLCRDCAAVVKAEIKGNLAREEP